MMVADLFVSKYKFSIKQFEKQFTALYIVIKIDFVAPALLSMMCSH